MAIKALLISGLEKALNKYLSLDPDADHFLAPLAGKVIGVTITPFNETIYLCPTPTGIQLLDAYPDVPDTQLSGSLFAFGLMGLSKNPSNSLFSGSVTIQGDTQTGHRFQELFSKLDIDLEEQLSQVTGDVIAHKVGQFFRAGQNWTNQTIETFQLNLTEFLQEELRELPAPAEMTAFYRQVDELRMDYDRLASRIERLERQRHTPQI